MRTVIKEEAIKLRQGGWSLGKISEQLGVSKSTASLWLRGVEVPPEHKTKLHANWVAAQKALGEWRRSSSRELREQQQQQGREYARLGNIEHLKGCMLYWAEGSKRKNEIQFANTDADMVLCFKNFLDKFFQIKKEDYIIRLDCYLGDGIREDDIWKFWLNHLSLPDTSKSKSVFKTEKPLGTTFRSNRHRYGVCSLIVYQTRIVQHIFGAIQEYIGTDKKEWLG